MAIPVTDTDTDPYCDIGKTCFGGGMHCPNAFNCLLLYVVPGWVRNIAIFMSVSVCPLAHLKNHMSKLHEIFCTVHVTCGRGSVLL